MNKPISYNELPTQHEILFTETRDFFDFTIYESGWEINTPSKGFGPYVRDYYVIHFIVDGKGFYEINDKVHTVKKNQLFLIPPNVSTKYYADSRNPWKYFWIGFNAQNNNELLKLCGFAKDSFVLNFPQMGLITNCAHLLNGYKNRTLVYEQIVLGLLHQSIGILSAKNSNLKQYSVSDSYINAAISFMKINYKSKITVSDVAKHVGLERTYFSKLFSSKVNVTPKEYLLNLKLSRSKKLLVESVMSSFEIASYLGFNDYSHFYKSFVNKYKITPNDYRERKKATPPPDLI